jgi:voltage-gated potassium channel
MLKKQQDKTHWKTRLHDIIYEADTKQGKLFDIILIFAIVFSIVLVMLESIEKFDVRYHNFLNIAEWVITSFLPWNILYG